MDARAEVRPAGLTPMGRKRRVVAAANVRTVREAQRAVTRQPPTAESNLTARELRILRKFAYKLVRHDPVYGAVVDMRFVGVYFLELFYLGWCPFRGLRLNIGQYDQAYRWWSTQPATDRKEVISLSRTAGFDSPTLKSGKFAEPKSQGNFVSNP